MGLNIIDGLKSAGKVLLEANKFEQYQQIILAQQKILNQQEEIALKQEKINLLKKQNEKLSEKIKTQNKLIYEENSYWIVEDNNKIGPYCSNCWDSNTRRVRMHDRDGGYYLCPSCKTGTHMSPEYTSVRTVKQPENYF